MGSHTAEFVPVSPPKQVQVGTSHTNNFNLLRIVAAIQVLFFHSCARLHVQVPGWLEPLNDFPGVPIFFVISGFLVSASYERNRTNLLGYFRNRAVRIFPGLWCCIVMTVVAFLSFGFHPSAAPLIRWITLQFVGLIYTPNFLQNFGSGTYNGSLWTIPIELQFYVVLPVLYWLSSKLGSRRWFMPAAFVFFAVLAVFILHRLPDVAETGAIETTQQKLLRYSFVPRFYLFVFGIVLQQFALQKNRFVAGKGLFWISIYLLRGFFVHGAIGEVVNMALLGLTAISCAYTLPRLSERIVGGWDISYGVYIYHGLMINLLVQSRLVGRYRDVGIVLLASLLAGAVSWTVIEKPALRRKKLPRPQPLPNLEEGVAVL